MNVYPHTSNYRKRALTIATTGIYFCSLLTSGMAQMPLPGNIQVGIGGRRFVVGGTIPVDKVASLFKSGKLRFQESVLKGDVGRAERWVKPEFVDDSIKGFPPIFYAAAQGNVGMVKLLVRNGASVNRRFHGKSLAYVAASYGHNATATVLVGLGGGRDEDISQGHALYAANEAERRRETQQATALALTFVAAMLSSSGSDSSSANSDHDRAVQANSMHEANQDAENRGDQHPFPGY